MVREKDDEREQPAQAHEDDRRRAGQGGHRRPPSTRPRARSASPCPAFFWGNVRRAAERAFDRLGMDRTKDRNGVLFFIVPSRKRFVVLGDEGIHAKVGQEFWDCARRPDVRPFPQRRIHRRPGPRRSGRRGSSWPLTSPTTPTADVNELPDDIDFGK